MFLTPQQDYLSICWVRTISALSLPWSCTYRMMLPRTPYSDTVQGSPSRDWVFSELRNILQSADGTWRRAWWPPAGRGRSESPRELRRRRSRVSVSSTRERASTPANQAANRTTAVMFDLRRTNGLCSSTGGPPTSSRAAAQLR